MNIFILDATPSAAARYHADIHLAKMVLEGAQMIATTLHWYGHPVEYKPTHLNHPCTKWVRESRSNIIWLHNLVEYLDVERRTRFGKPAKHKSLPLVRKWLGSSVINHIPDKGLTKFAQAMPEHFRSDDAVASYRAYYASKAATMPLHYTNVDTPEWLTKK